MDRMDTSREDVQMDNISIEKILQIDNIGIEKIFIRTEEVV